MRVAFELGELKRMGYRGSDLDLRTARTWSATSTDLMSGFDVPATAAAHDARAHRSGPIWVDETVLACANHAYDVALAHRAGEVRIEHFLHALTRVEAAARALEARGIPVVALRRDSAIVIASEIPIGAAGNGSPRRSPELEDMLRLAAAHTARAGRPAGVDDVLHVLVDLRRDLPGSDLLMRHLPRAAHNFWSGLGSARGSPYSGPAHFVDVAETQRPRDAAETTYLGVGRPAPAGAPAVLNEVADRLAEIERAMSERLAAVEAALASLSYGAPRDLEPMHRRLDVIERAVLAREGDGAMDQRLATLEGQLLDERVERGQALSSLGADMKALSSALGGAYANGAGSEPSIADRLKRFAEDLQQHRIELGVSLGDRIAAIEKALEAQVEKAIEARNAYGEELAEVHEALMKLNANQQTLAGSIDQWRSNEAGEIHLLNGRIGAVQEDGTKRLQMLERLCHDVDALSRSVVKDSAWRGFGYWLFGTDDWIKASWRPRTKPKA